MMKEAEEALEENSDNLLAALASTLVLPEEDQCVIIAAPLDIKPADIGGGARLSAVLSAAVLYLTFDAVYSSIAPAAAGELQLLKKTYISLLSGELCCSCVSSSLQVSCAYSRCVDSATLR
jgi:hypothetical protein